MKSNRVRSSVAALALSAAALVGLVTYEGYRGEAYIPVEGDVATLGFGSTSGVKAGDTTDPITALQRTLADVARFEAALKRCVKVDLFQHEYDSYIQLSYNIGSSAFCNSTLVKKLNTEDYVGACNEILRWVYFQGNRLKGLVSRRKNEYALCVGEI